MSLELSAEQRQLADSLERFLQDASPFPELRKRLQSKSPDRLALWPGLAEIGVIGAAFDEAHGGFAGDARTVAIILSLLGASLAVEPLLACAVVCGRILQHCTTPRISERLDALIAGKNVCILAHDSGVDPFGCPSIVADKREDSWCLSGRMACVRHADVAANFLVTAVVDGELAIFYVPHDTEGLTAQTYRLIDGTGAADLTLNELTLRADAKLQFADPETAVLRDALSWGVLGLAAEAVGIVNALNRETFQYLVARQQFGVAIGTNQALQHRAADMYIAAEEMSAILDASIDAMASQTPERWSILTSAAKVVADVAGRRVGHEAVQLHGGMGVSDELIVSHYVRRLSAIRACLGTADVHRLRYAYLTASPKNQDLSRHASQADTWRYQVRQFITEHLSVDLGRKVALGLKLEKSDYVGWQKILFEKGWFAGAWPLEFGGQGWDLVKQLEFIQECALCNAPMIIPYGVNMVGPVIYTYGTPDQKAEHLPAILSSDVWWCQGYSEPGAGSDLASLKTVAVRDGDHYIVNGTKMWTTEAHWADKMHCLVRTAAGGKPQNGITFLLVDMRTPGITVQPIVTIDGLHHTNQVFLDNVRVPVSDRVGEEGFGWTIAKFLLGNERTSIADTGPKLRMVRHLKLLQEQFSADRRNSEALKTLLDMKLADLEIQLMTLVNLESSYVRAWQAGKKMGAEASILKIRGTEILQSLTELALEYEGVMAAAHDPIDLHLSPKANLEPYQRASLVAHGYLYGRCWSIFGGTNEIQRNIIARSILRT
jgi:alkylation response protein AidB-like acyl-CoA dehydrogenase